MGEWRHRDMFRPQSPAYAPTITAPTPVTVNEGSTVLLSATAAPPIARPWMEFFEATASRGRFVVVDHDDINKDNFDDFKNLDKGYLNDPYRFTDRAASWRWFAPATCAIRANEHHIGDDGFPGARTRTLFGTGQPEADDNLHNVMSNNGVDDMFRVVSSVQFSTACSNYYSASIGVRWDLDLDGTPETAGNNVTFSAAAIDGPSDLPLAVQAQHPFDGRIANRTIAVTVNNVSPVIDSWGLVDRFGRRLGIDVPFALRGRPIRGLGTFSDAGTLDRQTASAAWGDGVVSQTFAVFNDAFGGVEGHVEGPHAYAAAGQYTVTLRIKDDDQGTDEATADITIATPGQAVGSVVGMLDTLIATATNPALKHLQAARKALVGQGSGQASGALHKINEGQTAAALAHLANALSDLRKATGVDTTIIIAILEEVVASLTA